MGKLPREVQVGFLYTMTMNKGFTGENEWNCSIKKLGWGHSWEMNRAVFLVQTMDFLLESLIISSANPLLLTFSLPSLISCFKLLSEELTPKAPVQLACDLSPWPYTIIGPGTLPTYPYLIEFYFWGLVLGLQRCYLVSNNHVLLGSCMKNKKKTSEEIETDKW